MIYFLWFIILVLMCTTTFLAIYCYRFARTIIRVQDSIEDCLAVMDERIRSIDKVLEIPLFFDSPEIRRVHDDLRLSRDAIIKVAETFSTIENEVEEEE